MVFSESSAYFREISDQREPEGSNFIHHWDMTKVECVKYGIGKKGFVIAFKELKDVDRDLVFSIVAFFFNSNDIIKSKIFYLVFFKLFLLNNSFRLYWLIDELQTCLRLFFNLLPSLGFVIFEFWKVFLG